MSEKLIIKIDGKELTLSSKIPYQDPPYPVVTELSTFKGTLTFRPYFKKERFPRKLKKRIKQQFRKQLLKWIKSQKA